MSADPELRERLERAVAPLSVDADRRLERIHLATARRSRGQRMRALAVAAAIGVVAVILVWQLRLVDRDDLTNTAGLPAGRIAYLGTQGDHRGLFAFDVATGDIAPLTDGAGGSVLWAAWSPDGSRLASIEERPGRRYAIVISEADGSRPVTIVEEEATGAVGPDLIDVAWSPDGSMIAYSGRTVEDGVARRTIVVVNADGSGAPVVLDGLWTSVSWSPDGGRLLVEGFPHKGHEGQFDLYAIRPDGSDPVQLTDDESGEHEPSWSPDGTQIVFATGETDFSQDLFVMDADGSDVRMLTDWEGVDLFPVWSPDGRWIAFASDRDATPAQRASNRSGDALFTGLSVHVIRPDGSDVSKLLEGDAVLPVAWGA
jgi:Tol biopolymer transport system component